MLRENLHILAINWELYSSILHIFVAEYHYTLGCLVLVWMLCFSYIQVCWLWVSGSHMRSGRFPVQLPFPSSLCLGSYLSYCKWYNDHMNYLCIQIVIHRYSLKLLDQMRFTSRLFQVLLCSVAYLELVDPSSCGMTWTWLNVIYFR